MAQLQLAEHQLVQHNDTVAQNCYYQRTIQGSRNEYTMPQLRNNDQDILSLYIGYLLESYTAINGYAWVENEINILTSFGSLTWSIA